MSDMLNPNLQRELVDVANRLADAARPETLRYFRQSGLSAQNKETDGFDPVTEGDRAAERAMRDLLDRLRPDDAVLGEEFGEKPGTSGLTWILDPIDGTRGYISGTPTWGVLISVSDMTGPLFGIIDQPYIGERFSGGFGSATLIGPHGSQPLAARKSLALDQATLLSTYPEIGTKKDLAAFRAVADQVRLTRYGMDCYAYALVACGQIDLVIEAGLQPYDIAAPIAVVRAAGGVVTDWNGGPAHEGGRVIAAGCHDIHAAALAVLRDVTGSTD